MHMELPTQCDSYTQIQTEKVKAKGFTNSNVSCIAIASA